MSSTTVLTLNPGSSSLKAAVFDAGLVLSIGVERLATDQANLTVSVDQAEEQRAFTGGITEAIAAIAAELRSRGLEPDAVGHRVVHGGPKHYQPTVIDDSLLNDLHDAIPLAPLHLPGDLEAIAHARRTWPTAEHIACFDTGFHHDLPDVSRRLPVPEELANFGVRRYGFHGLSVQSVLHARPDLGGAVIAHLGSGCSVTAVADGKSRHTTMSLTPTGGTVSATRTGDLDPEIVLYLIQQHGYSVDGLREVFDHRSGLAGIADGRHDVRDLLAAGASGDANAVLALEIFVASIAAMIAGCATHLEQWDSLVFTGGIGEHAEGVRARICAALLPLRSAAKPHRTADAVADLAATGLRIVVVPADEEGVIDRLTRSCVQETETDKNGTYDKAER
ncbi:acetate/propionate family kinase [Jatrophihabitans sp. DSM 45814]